MSTAPARDSRSHSLRLPPSALDEDEAAAQAIEGAVREHKQLKSSVQATEKNSSYVIPATFASAGLGNAISAATTNPFDVIKVRQQLLLNRSGSSAKSSNAAAAASTAAGVEPPAKPIKANFWSLGREMARREGVLALWSGVTASCLRELSYSTVRMGGYEPAKEAYKAALPSVSPDSFLIKVLAGVTSGALGAAIASPTDLVKVSAHAHFRVFLWNWI